MKEFIKKIKKYFPEIRKMKVDKNNYIEICTRGNVKNYWGDLKIFQIGFSGSINDPYCALHVYLWKFDLVWWSNPFKKIMGFWKEFKQDRYAKKKSDDRCPNCGGNGMAYEPIVYCKKCGAIIWEPEDITPYII